MKSAELVSCLLAMAFLVSLLPPTFSGEVETANPMPPPVPHKFNAFKLIAPMLTGRSPLIAEGIDPVTSLPTGEVEREKRAPEDRGQQGPRLTPTPALQAPGAAGVLIPFRSPAPAFSRNVLLTRDFSPFPYQTEPHIAVNPRNPDHILVGVIDYNFPSVSAYVSIDGGETWEGPKLVKYLGKDLATGGDPVVGFDRNGVAYYVMLSLGIEDVRIGPFVIEEVVSSAGVAVSTDGGFSWSEPVSSARSRITLRNERVDELGRLRGQLAFGFIDKPWMAVGPDRDDPRRDAVYVTYTEFATVYDLLYIGELVFLANPVLETTIKLVKGTNEGRTWSAPISVSPTVIRWFGPGGPKRVLQGSNVAVAPDGTVYVAYLDTLDDGEMEGLAEIKVVRSTDGGRTWSRPVTAAVFNEIPFTPRNANFRYWGSAFPQMALGPRGEVYVVFVGRPGDRPLDDGDVYFVSSTDGGATWSRPLRLNDDDTNRLQFFPAISADPKGVIHVIWGDFRDDPSETRYHIYYTRSEDGGRTWGFLIREIGQRVVNTRVTDAYSNPNFCFPNGAFIGDYFAIKATENDVYAVWADCRLGEFLGLNQKIGFARVRPMRSPSVFIGPSVGTSGQSVTIRGTNFQPDSNVYIEVSGSVIATTKSGPDGSFTVRLFMPVTTEGTQTVVVYDQTGNFASASFYTQVGIDTLWRGFEQMRSLSGQIFDSIKALNRTSSNPEGVTAPRGTESDWLMPVLLTVAAVAALNTALLVVLLVRSRRR
ncbi:MAG: glycoside hydrolase [Thaumarchaeota archaeon]|nr:glycoside hydrolase [Candidatus Calditenuaceae archaeon]